MLLALVLAQTPAPLLTPTTVQQSELALRANPRNSDLAGQLLDFYLARYRVPSLRTARLQLILWLIDWRPDLDLLNAGHDPRGFLIDPDDKEAYAQTRQAWLVQVSRQPSNARVLANAAECLRLTDRLTAANWLKTAMTYDSDNLEYPSALAMVYAYALTGVAAMTPFEVPTRFDPLVARSYFAQQARSEASQDSVLEANVGWAVHLLNPKFDPLAEELLLEAANQDYPQPAHSDYLARFYRDRKISSPFPAIELTRKEAAKAVVTRPPKLVLDDLTAPVKVLVNVSIGPDGRVWSAEAADASGEGANDAAARLAIESMPQWTFKPQRVSGEPVQATAALEVTVEPPEKKGPGK